MESKALPDWVHATWSDIHSLEPHDEIVTEWSDKTNGKVLNGPFVLEISQDGAVPSVREQWRSPRLQSNLSLFDGREVRHVGIEGPAVTFDSTSKDYTSAVTGSIEFRDGALTVPTADFGLLRIRRLTLKDRPLFLDHQPPDWVTVPQMADFYFGTGVFGPPLDIVQWPGIGQQGVDWITHHLWEYVDDHPYGLQRLPTLSDLVEQVDHRRQTDEDFGDLQVFQSHWVAVLRLLLYRLGWRRPLEGLLRWRSGGYPTDEPHLAALHRLLQDDVEQHCLDLMVFLSLGCGWRLSSNFLVSAAAEERMQVPVWLARHAAWGMQMSEGREFLPGGADHLHLVDKVDPFYPLDVRGRFNQAPATGVVSTKVVDAHYADIEIRSGDLVESRWYWLAQTAVDGLPARSDGRSWRIRIRHDSLPATTTFRLSRETEQLFACTHTVHMWGNPKT